MLHVPGAVLGHRNMGGSKKSGAPNMDTKQEDPSSKDPKIKYIYIYIERERELYMYT